MQMATRISGPMPRPRRNAATCPERAASAARGEGRAVGDDHRPCAGAFPGLGGHQLVQAEARIGGERRVVPLHQDLGALRGGEERQLRGPRLRIGDGEGQEVPHLRQQAAGRGGVEKVAVVLDGAGEAPLPLLHLEGEVELGGREIGVDRQHRQAFRHRGRARRRPGPLQSLEREHHLEQRRVRQVALGRQLLHQLLEGEILVGVGSESPLADAGDQLPETRISGVIAGPAPGCWRRTRSAAQAPDGRGWRWASPR